MPPLPAGHPHKYHLPRPVVLDANLRLSTGCKLLKNYKAGNGRRPWLIATRPQTDVDGWDGRKAILQDAGAQVVEVEGDDGAPFASVLRRTAHSLILGRINIPALLRKLREFGIRSLMVEGGARVIQSFLNEPRNASDVIDSVIVTVAPTFVGDDGVGYGANISGGSVSTGPGMNAGWC